jgi:hypothetical protein
MRPSVTERRLAPLLVAALLAPAALVQGVRAQEAAPAATILSSEITVSREEAVLALELEAGRTLRLAIRDGDVLVDDTRVGGAQRRGPLDSSWRALLTEALDAPTAQLPGLLLAWSPPAGPLARRMTGELRSALAPPAAEATTAPAEAVVADAAIAARMDSLRRLEDRVRELEQDLRRRERQIARATPPAPAPARWWSPLRHVGRGLAGIFSVLAAYAVLVAIGFAFVFFGRRNLERVADTARAVPGRAFAVGLAGSFLAIPVFIMGIIVLAISIVGIPVLILWAPLFPVALLVSALVGYLAAGHAVGEAVAERRFYGGEWFERANSYYFLVTGLALLLGLFVAANAVTMAGPWLRFLHGLLTAIGLFVTWLAITTGFGAVLLSRAGTRATWTRRRPLEGAYEDLEEEETHV